MTLARAHEIRSSSHCSLLRRVLFRCLVKGFPHSFACCWFFSDSLSGGLLSDWLDGGLLTDWLSGGLPNWLNGGFLTDWLDGKLAILWKQQTTFGARLDSVAEEGGKRQDRFRERRPEERRGRQERGNGGRKVGLE